MTGFHTLEQWSFYAIPVFAMAVASGAWCIRLAFRYAGLLQRISGHEEGAPSDRPGDTKQGGQGRVYNVSDPMPYFDASGWFVDHDADPDSLLARAAFATHMPYPGDAPRWHAVSRWGGAVLFGALITVFHSCHGLSLFFAALCAAAGILLVLAIVDAKTALLPDALTLPLLWLGDRTGVV